MSMSFDQIAVNLGVAIALGAAIGVERQWRQRLAGLRTNTLVALGAASFVVFSALVPGDTSPTRVAAAEVPPYRPCRCSIRQSTHALLLASMGEVEPFSCPADFHPNRAMLRARHSRHRRCGHTPWAHLCGRTRG